MKTPQRDGGGGGGGKHKPTHTAAPPSALLKSPSVTLTPSQSSNQTPRSLHLSKTFFQNFNTRLPSLSSFINRILSAFFALEEEEEEVGLVRGRKLVGRHIDIEDVDADVDN